MGFAGGDRGGAGFVEVEDGEHLAADGFVAGPEDEGGAPLHGFDGVREGEEIGADALGVHKNKVLGAMCQVRGKGNDVGTEFGVDCGKGDGSLVLSCDGGRRLSWWARRRVQARRRIGQ